MCAAILGGSRRGATKPSVSETLAYRSAHEEMGRSACPLCMAHPNCDGCLVAKKTRKKYCMGSPYDQAMQRWLIWMDHNRSPELRTKFREAARKELEFLKGLKG